MIYQSPVQARDFHPDTKAYFAGACVAVTGGSGFVGSHVVEQLLALGARVIVPSRQAPSPPFLAHLSDRIDVRPCDFQHSREPSILLVRRFPLFPCASTRRCILAP